MENPNFVTGLILILVVLALFAGVILLYRRLDRRERSEHIEPIQTAMPAPIPVTGPAAPAAPPAVETTAAALNAAINDDLTVIEGIGPVIAQKLSGAGIHTFQQLADTETEHIEVLLTDAGLRMIDASTWRDQARLAAAGEWEELDHLQHTLKSGRRTL